MKKPFIFLSLGAVVGCTFFGIFLMNVLAKEPPGPETASYYTCIRIQPGDTLWSIAEVYTGNYLTVMYKHPKSHQEAEE